LGNPVIPPVLNVFPPVYKAIPCVRGHFPTVRKKIPWVLRKSHKGKMLFPPVPAWGTRGERNSPVYQPLSPGGKDRVLVYLSLVPVCGVKTGANKKPETKSHFEISPPFQGGVAGPLGYRRPGKFIPLGGVVNFYTTNMIGTRNHLVFVWRRSHSS
jgi:hypothetical protein